jgi:molybdate transport system substrate-binding protein
VTRRLAVALVVALTAAACTGSSAAYGGGSRTLTVLAAASLTEAFERIGADFEAQHPGVAVRFSFGPSDGLATQIDEGAPADVFASASARWMDDVQNNGPGVRGRVDFARNRLVIVTPSDDPAGISGLDDLAAGGVKLVLAAEGVPAGDYARQILTHAGISTHALANVVSNEQDVKGVIQKIVLGEADAGIVYGTDVTPAVAPDVREIQIPTDVNVLATYPIAVVATAAQPDLAHAFVEAVTGRRGQATLRSFGFLPIRS